MYQRSAGGRWLEILLFTLSSLILYHTGVGFILFLVPLQVVARGGVCGDSRWRRACSCWCFSGYGLCPRSSQAGRRRRTSWYMRRSGSCSCCSWDWSSMNLPLRRHAAGSCTCCSGPPRRAGIVAVPLAAAPRRDPGVPAVDGGPCSRTCRRRCRASSRRRTEWRAPSCRASWSRPSCSRSRRRTSSAASCWTTWSCSPSRGGRARRRPRGRRRSSERRPAFRFAEFRLEPWWLWPLIVSGALVLADLFFGISALGVRRLEHRARAPVPVRPAGPGHRALRVREARGSAVPVAAADRGPGDARRLPARGPVCDARGPRVRDFGELDPVPRPA